MASSLIWFLAFLPLPRCARLRMIHIILLRPLSLKKRSTAMTLCFTVTTDFQRPPLLGTHMVLGKDSLMGLDLVSRTFNLSQSNRVSTRILSDPFQAEGGRSPVQMTHL